jgi:prepilin-type N-terminal cleavage/methylation domain-containing protein
MKTQRGFTLIEVSIVLLIIAFTLGSIMIPLGTSLEQKAINDTKQQLADIKAAIINFTIANRRMPCSDTTTGNNRDGLENTTAGACTNEFGSIPHVTLNIPHRQDAWGQPFIYHVTASFADTAPGTTGPCATPVNANVSIAMCSSTHGNITVNEYNLSTGADDPAALNIAAIVLSKGKHFQDADNSAKEDENANNDFVYFKNSYNDRNSTMPFDDIVVWISPNELIGHLIQAQILP